jgi:hypothetical protein
MKRLLLPLLLSATACGPAEGDDLGTVSQTFTGGTATEGYDEVVFVFRQDTGGGCTGVLVAPDKVITTASCVDAQPLGTMGDPCMQYAAPETLPTIVVAYGAVLNNELETLGDVVDLAVAPTDLCHNNLAVLTLDAPVDEMMATPRPVRTDAVTAGEAITGVGFGSTDGMSGGSSGEKNASAGTIACVYPDCAIPPMGDQATFVSEDLLGCDADGGAPAIDADGQVAGLVSFGDGFCDSYTGYTDVTRFTDWLATVGVAAPDPDPDPDPEPDPDPDSDQPLEPTSEDGGCTLTAPGSPRPSSTTLLALALGALLTLRRRKLR